MYNDYYGFLLKNGKSRDPRGAATVAMRNVAVSFPTGMFPRRPKDNPAIGIIEGLQFIAGTFDKDAIKVAAPGAKHELFTHQSAYGPRVGEQFERIIYTLLDDPQTRRAVLMIAHPEDNPNQIPCTTSMQFQVWNNRLQTTVTMRSSDAVWGLPYDLIQFGMVSYMIAACLRIAVEQTTLNLGDAHIYDATQVQDLWGEDRLIMPSFTSLRLWQQWATGVVKSRLTREELERRFLASQAQAEDIYAMTSGGLS